MSIRKVSSIMICVCMLVTSLMTGCGMKADSASDEIHSGYTDETGSVMESELSDEVIIREINSNRYTQPVESESVRRELDLEGYSLLMENDALAVYFREENMGIRVCNKQTGYVWGALPEDKPDNMNKTWSGFANSIVSIEYITDEKLVTKKAGIGSADVMNEWQIEGNIFQCTSNFEKLGISFSFAMELTEDALVVSLDDSTIQETGEHKLVSMYFLPFLGCVLEEETNGYMFVPDGCGALISFQPSRHYSNGYYARVYGTDYGIINDVSVMYRGLNRPSEFEVDEERARIPVYGIVHGVGQDAWYAVIEEGAEAAVVASYPSGAATDYNWTSGVFVYRERYFQSVTRSGKAVETYQKTRNVVNPEISYHFLSEESADYVGMALSYKDYLEKNGFLVKNVDENQKDILLTLDLICADIEEGVVSNSERKNISSIEMIQSVAEDLKNNNVKNVDFTLKGWQKGGLNGYNLMTSYKKSAYGSMDILTELSQNLAEKGYNLNLYLNATRGNKYQMKASEDAGIDLGQDVISIAGDWLGATYFVRTDLAGEQLRSQVETLAENGFFNYAVDYFASDLYSENEFSNKISRKTTREGIQETMGALNENSETLALYDPNMYAWKYTDTILDCPIYSSQYIYETDTVPFLQIVLSGYANLVAPYANVSNYSPTNILRHIEYNVYPSFLLTEEANYDLQDTGVRKYTSTQYESWSAEIVEIYQLINEVLGAVVGQEITGREILDVGVVMVNYETGYVLVNYTGDSYTYQGQEIPALSAQYRNER